MAVFARNRTNSLPANFILKEPDIETKFRACGSAVETQHHVFSICRRNSPLINSRHDAIQSIFAEALLTEKPILEIITYRECTWSMINKRVDLQIYNRRGRELWMINVKTPSEMAKPLNSARKGNEKKYQQLYEEARQNHKEWTVRLGTLVVGCLGSQPMANDDMLKPFNQSKITLINLIRMCAISNVKYCTTICCQ